MSKGHMLCALLPLLVAMPDAPISDNQLAGMCRTLVNRVDEEIRSGLLLVDWLDAVLIIDGGE
ncbi:hypothetical protein ACQKIE_17455 [Luteibacter sp. NPDC031894]|jgi:hypothetical protein|uniref:hypothetical protein n=1 Tax=Luteibacter sp. NPDC031894 TaxID=3390572 RepID=UPI003D03106C